MKKLIIIGCICLVAMGTQAQKKYSKKQIESLKKETIQKVANSSKLAQVMNDKIFSFAELGFQEYETSDYITSILEENGFTIEKGVSGMETAWMAKWGSGKPVIAIGSDLDCIPKASQKPGVAYHDPMVEGAPGHGEGHNSGQAVNIVAALAVKAIMEREGLSGTLILWPGVAEEQLGSKAYFARDGYFDEVDVCLFTHVSSNLSTSWGPARGTGLVSALFSFEGESAHSAGAPWRGRSALDAVELMNIGWNFKREHIHPLQRSHYVVVDGGDQPNVVPSKASVWYYFREITYEGIKKNFEDGIKVAEGAALMTNTKMSSRILGSAWPRHFNKPIAEAMFKNIQSVGLPEWSEDDQLLATSLQTEVGSDNPRGLSKNLSSMGVPPRSPISGGSDDIGDISWTVPTVTLRFPANIPGLQGHHWSNAVAMATPIAHKGVVAGAKVMALTMVDLLLNPMVLSEAENYFNEQTKETKYMPFVSADDVPPVYINRKIMDEFRDDLKKFYYDEKKYDTYLEQLGIEYPTIRKK